MTTPQQQQKTLDYLATKLEDSGLYTIKRTGNNHSLFVRETTQCLTTPKTYEVIIPNFLARVDDCKRHINKNNEEGIYTAPLFYKDGKTAFALLQHTPTFWNHDQTLKHYSLEQKHSMLNLRDMERCILKQFGSEIAYYQPQTAHLSESIRLFTLDDVHLDYSHISPEDPLYHRVQNRVSLDYKLPSEKHALGPTIALQPVSEHDSYKRARLISYDNTPQEDIEPVFDCPLTKKHNSPEFELRAAAKRAYPHLPLDEAYQMYCGDKDD